MTTETTPPNEQPLAGIRVLELGSSVAAPYGTWVLGSLGAEVVKVERAEVGDDARQWGAHTYRGSGLWFYVLNSNKRSLAVDLKNPEQCERLQRFIVEEVDVVLQNLRPGSAEKLGLGAEELTARSPRLIYCSIGAFGKQGPYKDRPGYDPLMQAFGGLMSVTGEDGRPPVRIANSLIDMGTGMWSVIGIMAALQRRHATGRGGVVDTALFETALGWMTLYATDYAMTGNVAIRRGSGVSGIVPYQAYRCTDGYLVVGGGNDRLFAGICAVLGHPEWTNDPRFTSNRDRVENRDALNELFEPVFAEQSREHWQGKLDDAGVPSAPTQSIDEVLAHPQTQALGIMQTLDAGELSVLGLPITFDGVRPPARSIAPELGDANDEILGDGGS